MTGGNDNQPTRASVLAALGTDGAGWCVSAMRTTLRLSHNAGVATGWHADRQTGEPHSRERTDELFPTRIALIHSEISEALEGHRKNKPDDHLPHRPAAEVELADAVIRIFDLAGAMGYDVPAALFEKLAYNMRREDHTPAARQKTDGKRY